MRHMTGWNVGTAGENGPVWEGDEDDTCQYVNEAGQKCIRPRVHTPGLHRYPETEGESER
jgi:hypothetical protein